MTTQLSIFGADVTIDNLNRISAGVSGAGMVRPMRAATLLVTRDAKKLAPVDTGQLRANIAPEIKAFGGEIEGVVGSSVKYAPAMELGTPPHLVPLSELDVWARRHHISAIVVQRSIARKGTAPRQFLQGAFNKNVDAINKIFEDYVQELAQ